MTEVEDLRALEKIERKHRREVRKRIRNFWKSEVAEAAAQLAVFHGNKKDESSDFYFYSFEPREEGKIVKVNKKPMEIGEIEIKACKSLGVLLDYYAKRDNTPSLTDASDKETLLSVHLTGESFPPQEVEVLRIYRNEKPRGFFDRLSDIPPGVLSVSEYHPGIWEQEIVDEYDANFSRTSQYLRKFGQEDRNWEFRLGVSECSKRKEDLLRKFSPLDSI